MPPGLPGTAGPSRGERRQRLVPEAPVADRRTPRSRQQKPVQTSPPPSRRFIAARLNERRVAPNVSDQERQQFCRRTSLGPHRKHGPPGRMRHQCPGGVTAEQPWLLPHSAASPRSAATACDAGDFRSVVSRTDAEPLPSQDRVIDQPTETPGGSRDVHRPVRPSVDHRRGVRRACAATGPPGDLQPRRRRCATLERLGAPPAAGEHRTTPHAQPGRLTSSWTRRSGSARRRHGRPRSAMPEASTCRAAVRGRPDTFPVAVVNVPALSVADRSDRRAIGGASSVTARWLRSLARPGAPAPR